MGYRASNNRDRDAAIERRGLPLAKRLRQVDWPMLALMASVAAAIQLG